MQLEETEDIPVEDPVDVLRGITAPFEKGIEAGEIGDGIEITRGLLGSEPTIQVGPDPDVVGIPGQLADVVGVIEDIPSVDPREPLMITHLALIEPVINQVGA